MHSNKHGLGVREAAMAASRRVAPTAACRSSPTCRNLLPVPNGEGAPVVGQRDETREPDMNAEYYCVLSAAMQEYEKEFLRQHQWLSA